MVLEINVFRWLSRGTFNGFSHGMCARAWPRDRARELGPSQRLPPGGEDEPRPASRLVTRLTLPRLFTPRLISPCAVTPKTSRLEKETKREKKKRMEKGRSDARRKVFHCWHRCICARGKEPGRATDFLRASGPKMVKRISASVLPTPFTRVSSTNTGLYDVPLRATTRT